MEITLEGKAALVTGAGTGIGRAIALQLGRSGAAVAVHYHRSAAGAEEVVGAIREAGGRAVAVQGDLTREEEVDRVIAEAVAAFGRVDILVNNAGDLMARHTTVEMEPAFWDSVLDLNMRSAFLCTRAALKAMPDGGRIVNMTSLAGYNGGGPGASAYCAAKGAMVSWTRALAKELAPRKITVNGVAPGYVDTRFHEVHSSPAALEAGLQGVPLGRMGRPDEVAALAAFLASGLAGYITGEVVHINGGQYLG